MSFLAFPSSWDKISLRVWQSQRSVRVSHATAKTYRALSSSVRCSSTCPARESFLHDLLTTELGTTRLTLRTSTGPARVFLLSAGETVGQVEAHAGW